MADPELLDQFHPDSDLHPNEAEHSAHITILPQQGIPLDVAIRMQINVLYRHITCHVPLLEHVKPIFYPAVWFEVRVIRVIRVIIVSRRLQQSFQTI